MRIRRSYLVLLLLVGLPLLPVSAKPIGSAVIQSTVLILVLDQSGELSARASGVLVEKDGTVITNKHVVEDKNGNLVSKIAIVPTKANEEPNWDCVWFPTSVRRDLTQDLAVLSTEEKLPCAIVHTISLSSNVPPTGSDIRVLGYPGIAAGGLSITLTKGQVAGKISRKDGSVAYLKTDAKIISGTSGGPVVDDDGNLVGLATAFTFVTDVLGYADSSQEFIGLIVPSKNIAQFLGRNGTSLPTSVPAPTAPRQPKDPINAKGSRLDETKDSIQLEKIEERELLSRLSRDSYCDILIDTSIPGIKEIIGILKTAHDIRAVYNEYLRFLEAARKKNCNNVPWGDLLPADVDPNAWYGHEASELVLGGFIKKFERFRPHELATRSDVIKFIVKGKVSPIPDVSDFSFGDVSDDEEKYFEYAAQQGWLKGDGDCYGNSPCFARPNSPVTRAEVATLFMRAFDKVPRKITSPFDDNHAGTWFSDYVNDATSVCMLKGDTGKNTVRPTDNVTRAEMIVMFYRVYSDTVKTYPDCGYRYKRQPTYSYKKGQHGGFTLQ